VREDWVQVNTPPTPLLMSCRASGESSDLLECGFPCTDFEEHQTLSSEDESFVSLSFERENLKVGSFPRASEHRCELHRDWGH
jgi:hypothetical protein